MTLRAFLNAGYALLVSAWQSVDLDLVSAIERANEMIGLPFSRENVEQPVEAVPTASDNDRALDELEKMLGGVSIGG